MSKYIAKVQFVLVVKFKKAPKDKVAFVKSHLQLGGEEDIHNLEIVESDSGKFTITFDTKEMDEKAARFDSEFIAELDEDDKYTDVISNYHFLDNSFQYWPYKAAQPPAKKVASPPKKVASPPKKVASPPKKVASPPKKVASPVVAKASSSEEVLDKVKALVCGKSAKSPSATKKSHSQKKAASPKTAKATGSKAARCPKGTRRNKKTGECDPA